MYIALFYLYVGYFYLYIALFYLYVGSFYLYIAYVGFFYLYIGIFYLYIASFPSLVWSTPEYLVSYVSLHNFFVLSCRFGLRPSVSPSASMGGDDEQSVHRTGNGSFPQSRSH